MLGIEGAQYDNGELVLDKAKSQSLSQTKTEIARIKALVLANQAGSGSWRITNVSTNLDTDCTTIETAGGSLQVDPVCVNSLIRLTLSGQVMSIVPNPVSGDEFNVVSDEEIEELRMTNAVGEELTVSEHQHQVHTTSNAQRTHYYTLTTRSCSSGLYFIRAKQHGTWLTRCVMVVR